MRREITEVRDETGVTTRNLDDWRKDRVPETGTPG